MTDTLQRSDRAWPVLCHLSALLLFLGIPFGNIIGPLIAWLIKRGDSAEVDYHGREALNFNISWTLYMIVAGLMTVALMFILIGFLMLPLLIGAAIIVPIVQLILIIVASVKAGNGEYYRYPLTIRFL
jgi:uncharacterized Tic20 family protein